MSISTITNYPQSVKPSPPNARFLRGRKRFDRKDGLLEVISSIFDWIGSGEVVESCSFSPAPPYQFSPSDESFRTGGLRIRAAELRDARELTELLMASFHPPEGLVGWIYPLLKLGIYEDVRARLASHSPNYQCLVASQATWTGGRGGETLVGTVEIALRAGWLGNSRFPYLSNLAVSNVHRRQGVAQKLLNHCENIARDWGCPQICLHVLEDNPSARNLYLKSGYRVHRVELNLTRRLFGRPKCLLLRKEIDGG